MRIAVVGHVEHVTLGRVSALMGPGDIAHLEAPRFLAGGGGGIALFQLARSSAEVHFFTALGNDEAAAQVERALCASGATVHAARREQPHTRDLVLVPPGGDRAIAVVGEPLHPARADALAWDLLTRCDAAYFTAQDPAALQAARAARTLVVTARRRAALLASGVRADVVVGSALDPREACALADFPVPPAALVLTEGGRGGSVHTARGVERFQAAALPFAPVGTYDAGDSFAGALTFYAARGLPVARACARASAYGAAVLRGLDPLEHQLRLE